MSDAVKIKHVRWRNGRPRFDPSLTLRHLGYRSRDLKDDRGQWFTRKAAQAFSDEVSSSAAPRKAQARTDGRRLAVRRQPVVKYLGYIYFVRSRDRIKIGFSSNPVKRLMVLKTSMSHQIECLIVVPGTRHDEQKVHRLLSPYRQHGEWFDAHPVVVKVMIRSATFGKPTLEGPPYSGQNRQLSQHLMSQQSQDVARGPFVHVSV